MKDSIFDTTLTLGEIVEIEKALLERYRSLKTLGNGNEHQEMYDNVKRVHFIFEQILTELGINGYTRFTSREEIEPEVRFFISKKDRRRFEALAKVRTDRSRKNSNKYRRQGKINKYDEGYIRECGVSPTPIISRKEESQKLQVQKEHDVITSKQVHINF